MQVLPQFPPSHPSGNQIWSTESGPYCLSSGFQHFEEESSQEQQNIINDNRQRHEQRRLRLHQNSNSTSNGSDNVNFFIPSDDSDDEDEEEAPEPIADSTEKTDISSTSNDSPPIYGKSTGGDNTPKGGERNFCDVHEDNILSSSRRAGSRVINRTTSYLAKLKNIETLRPPKQC